MLPKKIVILSVAISLISHVLVLSLTGLFDMPGSAASKDAFTVDLKDPPEKTNSAPAHRTPPQAQAVPPQAEYASLPLPSGEETLNLDSVETRYTPYLKRLRDKIARVWTYPAEALARKEEGISVVRFSLSKSGVLVDLRTVTPSGSSSVDQGALNAVRSATPYEPLPQNLTKLNIIATFRCRLAPATEGHVEER